MQTIQQKLADRIYELLPHKKKLEFGCEVKAQRWNKNQNLSWGKGAFIQKDMFSGNPYIMYSKNDLDFAYHKIEIIGQPIRLADVLRVIDDIAVNTGDNVREELLQALDLYNLQQDNLLNQSDDFCEFIYNLIK